MVNVILSMLGYFPVDVPAIGQGTMNQATITDSLSEQPSIEEMRGAQRFTLLIRTAKLVSESGEFLCIIRDVSETGVRLRLFHQLPAGDERMALELANGELYFIERVWERDGHAGFRFAAPIDVEAFIAEVSPHPRRQPRLRVQFPAVLSADGPASVATVRDLSPHGARIALTRFLAVGQRVKLEGEGFPANVAKVCWRSGADYGLAFEQIFTLETFARLAAQLQGIPAEEAAGTIRQQHT